MVILTPTAKDENSPMLAVYPAIMMKNKNLTIKVLPSMIMRDPEKTQLTQQIDLDKQVLYNYLMMRFQILRDHNHKEDLYNVGLNLALNKHLITSRPNNQVDNLDLEQDQLPPLQDQLKEEMLYKI